jgi:hypothetical protein
MSGRCNDPFISDSDDEWNPYGGTQSQEHTQVNEVGLSQVADHESNSNDDQLSTLRYSIHCKVRVNQRSILDDTEQDVALAPAVYWDRFLRTELETAVRKWEQNRNKALKSEGGSVAVSVSKHGQKKFTKPFEGTNINWSMIENQLLKWGDFFHEGKTLSLDLTFNYVEDTQPPSTTSQKGNNRGRLSRTQRMLADGDMLQAAEEGSPGSIWKELFDIFRCPGDHCSKGPHCWVDPVDGKHYPLTRYYMRSLIKLAQEGLPITGYDDVPQDIRNQLYAVDRQSLERRQKASSHATAPETNGPNIKITNVMPSPSPLGSLRTTTPVPDMPQVNHLDIPGSRDANSKEYFIWQQSQYDDPHQKKEFDTAFKAMRELGLDLETICQHPRLFTILTEEKNVSFGSALHIMGDIGRWADLKRKRAEAEGDGENHRKRRM